MFTLFLGSKYPSLSQFLIHKSFETLKTINITHFKLFTVLTIFFVYLSRINAYEGFGSVTKGAEDYQGFETYHVTSLNDAGTGTLRDAVSKKGRYIVFDVGGVIELKSTLNFPYSYITIDGLSAPSPGITISTPGIRTCIEAKGSIGPAHDIIIHNIRIVGSGGNVEEIDILEFDGSNSPIYNVIYDHITANSAGDGVFDFWGEVHDVSVSYCLIMKTEKACHFSNADFIRERISIHHNVYAKNNERQIKMRYKNDLIDYVNNTVYGWGWYEGGASGLYIGSNEDISNEEYPKLNVENNIYHFVPDLDGKENDAIVRDIEGRIYFNGNRFPEGETDDNSTSPQHVIPSFAQVKKYPVEQLGDSVVPFVGTHYRSEEESSMLQEISIVVGGSGLKTTARPSYAFNASKKISGNGSIHTTYLLINDFNGNNSEFIFNALGRNIPRSGLTTKGLYIGK